MLKELAWTHRTYFSITGYVIMFVMPVLVIFAPNITGWRTSMEAYKYG